MSDIRAALDLWNETADICGWPLVRGLTSDRERKLRKILRAGLDEWKEALAKAQLSDFLCGRVEKSEKHAGWRLTFDRFVSESFFVKVIEGNYDNREVTTAVSFKSPDTIVWEARLRGHKPDSKFWHFTWGTRPEEGRPDGCPSALYEQWRQKHSGAH